MLKFKNKIKLKKKRKEKKKKQYRAAQQRCTEVLLTKPKEHFPGSIYTSVLAAKTRKPVILSNSNKDAMANHPFFLLLLLLGMS